MRVVIVLPWDYWAWLPCSRHIIICSTNLITSPLPLHGHQHCHPHITTLSPTHHYTVTHTSPSPLYCHQHITITPILSPTHHHHPYTVTNTSPSPLYCHQHITITPILSPTHHHHPYTVTVNTSPSPLYCHPHITITPTHHHHIPILSPTHHITPILSPTHHHHPYTVTHTSLPYNCHTVPQAVTGDIVMETHNTRITSPQPPIALVNVGFPHDKVIILLLQLRTTISDNLFCFRIKVM